jgi:hypothetical protein
MPDEDPVTSKPLEATRNPGPTPEVADVLVGALIRYVGPESPDPAIIKDLVEVERRSTLVRQFGALLLILVGAALVVLGATGNIEWVIPGSRLMNASPGVVAIIAGTLVMLRARPDIEINVHVTPPAGRQRARDARRAVG